MELKWHKCVICKISSPIRVVYYKMLFSTCSTGLQALVSAYETLRNPEKLAAEEMQQRVTNTTSNEMPTIVEKCGETCYGPIFLSHGKGVHLIRRIVCFHYCTPLWLEDSTSEAPRIWWITARSERVFSIDCTLSQRHLAPWHATT